MLIPGESSVGCADAVMCPVTLTWCSRHWDGGNPPWEITAVEADLETGEEELPCRLRDVQ